MEEEISKLKQTIQKEVLKCEKRIVEIEARLNKFEVNHLKHIQQDIDILSEKIDGIEKRL